MKLCLLVLIRTIVLFIRSASTLNDGASALILASQEKVDELKLAPLARIVCASCDRARD